MWLYDWSEEGLEIQCIGDDILGKLVPPHVNIFTALEVWYPFCSYFK